MAIVIAPQYTQRIYRWSAWKISYASKGVLHQHDDDGVTYTIWFYDGPEAHICTIWKGEVPHSILEAGYSQEQNDSDRSDFEANFVSSSNRSLRPKNSLGIPLQTIEPRLGTELIVVTHNFSDPTTWYSKSMRKSSVIMTASVDNLDFTCPWNNWIDMTHGKLFDEDSLKSDIVHQYSASVWVDGILKNERAPFAMSGGDYVIDYKNGKITFPVAVTGSVTSSFSYATDSTWIFKPDPGKKIDIEQSEVQFGLDTVMTDTVEFQIWVYNPYDLPNKVMIDKTSYKTVRNIIDEALGSYPVIKAFGGAERGIVSDVYGFPFRYGAVRSMKSSQGVELRIKLANDIPFSGTYTTATFYTTVHDDT